MLAMRKLARLFRYDWPMHFVLLATNWLPDNVAFLRFRGWLASHFLGSCGKDLRLGRNVTFYNPVAIDFGNHIYVALGCWFMAGGEIRVEDEVLFGPYCVVVSSAHAREGGSFRYGPPRQDPIWVGRGCWLAAHVVVSGGASIGEGCLVAAQSVVTGPTPPNAMVVGQPAKPVKEMGWD